MAQNNSWKKYGGINNYENLSNINVNGLVANNLSLRHPYLGIFTICGDLIVTQNTYVNEDLHVSGNIFCDELGHFYTNLDVSGNVDISSNLYVIGNSYLYNPLYLVGNHGQGTNYFMGGVDGIGLNKMNPKSTLDINGISSEVLNVYTSSTTNRNILARNNVNHGIVLSTDLSYSYIDFYNKDYVINSALDKGKGGGTIRYDPSGIFTFDVSNSLNFLAKMSISTRSDLLSDHIHNETLVVYDNSNNIFRQDIYNNSKLYNGTALSLISSDNSANTFLQISTPNSKGWAIGGGMFPNDISRNMGTMGWIDVSGQYIPSELFVSGNSLVNNRATVGFNTFSPETEQYIIDANGPIHLHHNEIHLIQNVSFQINSISFDTSNTNYGVAIGTSLNTNAQYRYNVLYTINGGKTWNISDIKNSLGSFELYFSVFYYNSSNILIAANNGNILLSTDSGKTWGPAGFSNLPPNDETVSFYENAPSVYANILYGSTRVYLSFPYDINNSRNSSLYKYDGYPPNSVLVKKNYNFNIFNIHGYFHPDKSIGRLFLAGSSIYVLDAISLNTLYTFTNTHIYKKIYTYDGSFAIAIDSSSAIYTKNGGLTWNIPNIFPYLSSNLNDICIWDVKNAIAVGNNGLIIYTTDSAKTWQILNMSDINAMGNGYNIINTSKNLTAIRMINSYTFSIACVSRNYNKLNNITGITDMFYLHLPDLFNRYLYPSILDVCGNMTITGDIHINDYGKLQSNNKDFYMIDETVQTVYFARDASNIHIGNIISGGETTIQQRLSVLDDCSFNNRLFVGNDVSFNSKLFVNKDVSFNNRLFVGQDVSFNANLFVNNKITFGNQIINNNSINPNTLYFPISLNYTNSSTNGDVFATSKYIYVIFKTTGTITFNTSYDISYIIIGGGGSGGTGGGTGGGGGGGAGEVLVGSTTCSPSTTYNATVGSSNSNSIFSSYTAKAGGNGGGNGYNGLSGGSSGGGGGSSSVLTNSSNGSSYYSGSSNPTSYVNRGGTNFTRYRGGGGGGGSGSAGNNSFNNSGGSGGQGTGNVSDFIFDIRSSNIMSSNWNTETANGTIASGGRGGNYSGGGVGSSGTNNTGNGGFGGGDTSSSGGSGGSGIVILRFLNPNSNVGISISSLNNGGYISTGFSDSNLNLGLIKNSITQVPAILQMGYNSSNNTFLNVNSDVSFNNRLFVGRDVSLNANLYVAGNTLQAGNLTVNADVSCNNRLFVGSDVSLNANLYVAGNFFCENFSNSNINGPLNVTGDVSFNANLYVAGNTLQAGNLTVNADVSFNNRLFVGRDVSLNANLYVVGNTLQAGNLIVNADVSFNNRLFVGRDVSFNANLFVNKDVYMNNRLNVGNVSFSDSLFSSSNTLKTETLNINVDVSLNNLYGNIISAISFNATSDYRIKENIRHLTQTVDNLKPIHYYNKSTKKEDIGLIAHELQEEFPFLVTGEKDDNKMQSVNYIGLIGILIKEIQDLKKRVYELESKF